MTDSASRPAPLSGPVASSAPAAPDADETFFRIIDSGPLAVFAQAESRMSLFASARATTPRAEITIAGLVAMVRAPEPGFAARLAAAREALENGETERFAALKRELPAVSIAGTFSARNNKGLLVHSGLMPIDLDHLTPEAMADAKRCLNHDPFCAFYFVSPSGRGLKGAICLAEAPADDASHKLAFEAVRDHFRETYDLHLDPACKDVARLAFLSHDPECYHNAQAEPFDAPSACPLDSLGGYDSGPAAAQDSRTSCIPHQTSDITVAQPAASGEEFEVCPDNDAGRAARFVERWRHEIRFVPERGYWLVWEGRWVRDIDGGLMRRAIRFVKEALAETLAAPANSPEELKAQGARLRHVQLWGNRTYLEAMLVLARSQSNVQVRVADLDANPYLLGTPNAVIDLRTGEAFPHQPDHLITLCTQARFDASATAPRWERFMEEVFPDAELRRYTWKAAGYSITGCMGEESFHICHNHGRNGKSKFLNAIYYTLGDYADTAGQGLVIANERGDDPKREKAKIVGRRFLRAPETDARQRLNTRAVKDITGGDPLDAEAKYESPFSFKPVCKLWWACNHKPDIHDIGIAIWERVRLIPFERYFKPEERDPELETKLQAEASGILNWLIRGCLLWQKEGLHPPAKVRAAVEEYRRDEDLLADFIDECTSPDPGSQTPHPDLFRRYLDWARDAGLRKTLTSKGHAKALRDRGWKEVRTAQYRTIWVDVRLTDLGE